MVSPGVLLTLWVEARSIEHYHVVGVLLVYLAASCVYGFAGRNSEVAQEVLVLGVILLFVGSCMALGMKFVLSSFVVVRSQQFGPIDGGCHIFAGLLVEALTAAGLLAPLCVFLAVWHLVVSPRLLRFLGYSVADPL